MKNAIKIGDLFIMYDKLEMEPTGFWYELGYELSQYYQQFLAWLKKHKSSTNRDVVQRLICFKTADYSVYDIPTVYRKWRA